MKYRILMSMGVDARSDRQAYELALKLDELLKSPLVRMAVLNADIPLSGENGDPVVYMPRRER